MLNSLSKRRKVMIPLVLVVILALAGGLVYFLTRPVATDIDRAENHVLAFGETLTNRDYEAFDALFAPDAVFVYKESEFSFSDGREKLLALIDDQFTCATEMSIVTQSNSTSLTCEASGKVVVSGKKALGQYVFTLVKEENSHNWLIYRVESTLNDWFVAAFGETVPSLTNE